MSPDAPATSSAGAPVRATSLAPGGAPKKHASGTLNDWVQRGPGAASSSSGMAIAAPPADTVPAAPQGSVAALAGDEGNAARGSACAGTVDVRHTVAGQGVPPAVPTTSGDLGLAGEATVPASLIDIVDPTYAGERELGSAAAATPPGAGPIPPSDTAGPAAAAPRLPPGVGALDARAAAPSPIPPPARVACPEAIAPEHPPHLDDRHPAVVQVLADGRCLYDCVVAARDAVGWLASHDDRGHPIGDQWAADRDAALEVRAGVVAAHRRLGNEASADRLLLEGPDGYPGYEDLWAVSSYVGGQIIVQKGPSFTDAVGEGPARLQVLHTDSVDGAGNRTEHWALVQSWLPLGAPPPAVALHTAPPYDDIPPTALPGSHLAVSAALTAAPAPGRPAISPTVPVERAANSPAAPALADRSALRRASSSRRRGVARSDDDDMLSDSDARSGLGGLPMSRRSPDFAAPAEDRLQLRDSDEESVMNVDGKESKAAFARLFSKCRANARELAALKPDPPAPDDSLVAKAESLWTIVRSSLWPESVKHCTVTTFVIMQSRPVGVSRADLALLLHVALGTHDAILRAHDTFCYVWAMLQRYWLRAKGLSRTMPLSASSATCSGSKVSSAALSGMWIRPRAASLYR